MLTHLLTAALIAAPAADDALAVLAVDPSSEPRAELVEMTHQLRSACRERDAAVQDVRDTRARLLGDAATASPAELERAHAGALLAASHGDPASAARTLRGIVEELERGPDGAAAYEQWTRAQLRLARVEAAAGQAREYRATLERVVEVDPRVRADADQFSPTFRRDLDAARERVGAQQHAALRVATTGAAPAPLEVFVDGRPAGTAPVTAQVTAARHRVSAAAGALRIPATWVDVGADGAEALLDVELAAAVRANAGPALAVDARRREAAVVKAGAWVGASRVVAVSVVDDAGVTFLVGSAYDVRRGALLREGRVRTLAGLAAPDAVAALASFLLTGKASAAVVTAAPPRAGTTLDLRASAAPRGRARWLRPAALGSAIASVGLGALAVQQALSARAASSEAEGLLRRDGTYLADPSGYARLRASADGARRNAWIGAAGSAAFAAAAGVLGVLSWDRGAPVVRF